VHQRTLPKALKDNLKNGRKQLQMFAIDIYNKGLATKKKTKTFTTQQ
jgi:hypothetical protein